MATKELSYATTWDEHQVIQHAIEVISRYNQNIDNSLELYGIDIKEIGIFQTDYYLGAIDRIKAMLDTFQHKKALHDWIKTKVIAEDLFRQYCIIKHEHRDNIRAEVRMNRIGSPYEKPIVEPEVYVTYSGGIFHIPEEAIKNPAKWINKIRNMGD